MFTPKFSHPSFFAQIGWNFYQMTTTCRETKLRSTFWKFNFVQKLLQFQFRKFGRISHKFTDKNEILEYITQKDSRPTIFVQNGWNFHQMTTTCRGTKLRSIFGKFWILSFLYSFESENGPKNEKNRQNFAFSAHFCARISIKSQIFKIF